MNKVQRLAQALNNRQEAEDDAADLIRQQDEALRMALERLEHWRKAFRYEVDAEAIAKIKEVLHD